MTDRLPPSKNSCLDKSWVQALVVMVGMIGLGALLYTKGGAIQEGIGYRRGIEECRKSSQIIDISTYGLTNDMPQVITLKQNSGEKIVFVYNKWQGLEELSGEMQGGTPRGYIPIEEARKLERKVLDCRFSNELSVVALEADQRRESISNKFREEQSKLDEEYDNINKQEVGK